MKSCFTALFMARDEPFTSYGVRDLVPLPPPLAYQVAASQAMVTTSHGGIQASSANDTCLGPGAGYSRHLPATVGVQKAVLPAAFLRVARA